MSSGVTPRFSTALKAGFPPRVVLLSTALLPIIIFSSAILNSLAGLLSTVSSQEIARAEGPEHKTSGYV